MSINKSIPKSVTRRARPVRRCVTEVMLIDNATGRQVKQYIETHHVPTHERKHDRHGVYDVVHCAVCGERLMSYD